MKKLIYLISPNVITNKFYSDLKIVLATRKVKFFQLRLKNLSKGQIIKIGKKIKFITKKYNVKLIINDSSIIAKKIKADGCHIGQLDASVLKVKKHLINKIVGVTCHNSKKLAKKALQDNADYIAFGSFYSSKLKPNAKKANLNVLRWSKKNRIPLVFDAVEWYTPAKKTHWFLKPYFWNTEFAMQYFIPKIWF